MTHISLIFFIISGIATIIYFYILKESVERYLVFVAIYLMLLSIYFQN